LYSRENVLRAFDTKCLTSWIETLVGLLSGRSKASHPHG